MEVILWRHAEAEEGEPDLRRALTAKGEKQARRVAEWLNARLPDSAKILSSPALRAQQTAQALAEISHYKLKTVEALSPLAPLEDALDAIGWTTAKGTVVIVGHQPTLGQIANQLLTGHADDWAIKKSGLVWIRQTTDDEAPVLRAVISPDLV